MRRRSDRGKTKQPEQPKEESHEKSKKSHRHSRRRKKSSSSSEGPSETKEALENIPQPAEVEVKDIELPQGAHVQSENPSEKSTKSPEEPKEEWKEDNKFWESEGTKTTQESLEDGSKEKEESSLWKVQSANGAGGEIQKLKICRQRPADSPEIADSSLRKSPKNETLKSHSSRTSSDSEATEDDAESHKGKKKRGREVLSTVQLKKSSSVSPKRESPDSEDVGKKNAASQQENEDITNNKENEIECSPPHKENKPEETNGEQVVNRCPKPRKRRWGSSWSNRSDKTQAITISTDSLKMLIPDAKPIPAEELQLSVEEEEGQLDDDDEEDEVVALVVKEEERQLERERQKEEKKKEKEKQLEDKKKRQERFEKSKSEQTSPEENKVEIPRKIHLLTDDAKKLARLPSPPRRKPSSVLYITHLVRPFTVQQLKNLLLRTGTIADNGFWIDKIKSKCYVEYTTEDAAVETRHALHAVRWPTSNPKTLNVEFSTHDDLVIAQTLSEEPEVPRKAEPLTMVEGWVADQARIKDKTRRTVVREWDVGKPEHPDEILEQELKMKEKKELERKARKERPHRSATPEGEPPGRKARRKEEDAPAKLLDDLFRKTKTSPCIYWLPLTQEQISVKEEMRRQHMAEHERRMSELKKAELGRRDRERRSRK